MEKRNEFDSSTTFIKNFLLKIYSLRFYYIACLTLFITVAFLYNRYSPKVYEISSVIGPVQENQNSMLASNNMFRSVGSLNSMQTIEDAMNSLNSFSLISATVNNLNLEVGYFNEKKGLFKQTTELYEKSPILVNIDKSHIQSIYTIFEVNILSDSTFRIKASEKEAPLYNYIDNKIVKRNAVVYYDSICKFNKTIKTGNFKFSVSPNKEYARITGNPNNKLFFVLYHTERLAKFYQQRIQVSPISFNASIIKVKFSGQNLEKSLDFLNKYVTAFLEDNLAKKNKIAKSTVNFIDSQISEISDSLVRSASQLRNFRTDNQVMDLSFQGQRTYEQLSQIETERTSLETQIRYYNYVTNYFKTNKDAAGGVPSMASNSDPIMNQLITDLIALKSEKSGIPNGANGKNLFIGEIDKKIRMQIQAIVENATNNLNTLNLSLNELNYRADKLSKEISNLPRTEMNMVNMQRKFNLNDAIFTYLLQKRSEAAITLASNYPDYEILEPARAITSTVTKPKTMMSYMLAIFFALFIPTLVLLVKDFFNDKVSDVFDVERLVNRSVLGMIYCNTKKYENVVVESPNSAISESFRTLRSLLIFKLKNHKTKSILISSSQPQDGKSFISFNLAASFALAGFKTILLDCDLRRPTLHNKIGNDNSVGLSNYMIKKASEEEIIHKTSIENLSFIPAGPILPGPSELIDAGALNGLFESIDGKFDYIIIDTSPIGLVAEATPILKYASQVLLVARINATQKSILSNAINTLDANSIHDYEIIINNIDLKKSPYSNYGGYYKN